MPETYYFYDLETSGLSPRSDRIMQFAGIRTDHNFNIIGEPDNILIKMSDDTLPSPSAIAVTGITPNATLMDGITEREFCRYFIDHVALPGTTIIGYNSVRFDDEFIRYTLWRNFYDPYEWQWKDGRSRWDLLDTVRMTRVLRPEGINWPLSKEGLPTNRLEFISKANGIAHEHAHDAFSDVEALVGTARLFSHKQPQIFQYLYEMRDKKKVKKLVNMQTPVPFVYTSNRYPALYGHTTIAYPIAEDEQGNVIVFDLRENLDEILAAEAEANAQHIDHSMRSFYDRELWERDFIPVVKKLRPGHCPAVAPLSVLDNHDGWKKVRLTRDKMEKNLEILKSHPEFIERAKTFQGFTYKESGEPEDQLYDGFLDDSDRQLCSIIRSNDEAGLKDFKPEFTDPRLPDLFIHYKAKNYPALLSRNERRIWKNYRESRLSRQSPLFLDEVQHIQEIVMAGETYAERTPKEVEFLIQEVMLWCQNVQLER